MVSINKYGNEKHYSVLFYLILNYQQNDNTAEANEQKNPLERLLNAPGILLNQRKRRSYADEIEVSKFL